MSKEANLVYLLIMAVFFCSLAQLLLGALSIGSFARVLRVPVARLFPVVITLCCIGAYAIRSLDFDIVFFLGLGVFAYLLNILGFNMSAVVLGAFLAPTMESALMEALSIAPSKGGLLPYMASRPLALAMLGLLGLYLMGMLISSLRRSRACAGREGEAARPDEGECLPGSWRGERGTDFVLYGVILTVVVFFLAVSVDYPVKSRLFPHAVLGIAAVCCLAGLFRCIRFGTGYAGRGSPLGRVPWRKFLSLSVLLVGYAAGITRLGFYFPTFIFLVVAQPLTRDGLGSPGRVGRDVLFALITTFVVRALFVHLFLIDMPGPPWLE